MRTEDILVLGGLALIAIGSVIILSDAKAEDADGDGISEEDDDKAPSVAELEGAADPMAWYKTDAASKRTAYSESANDSGEDEAMKEGSEPYAITWDEFRDGYDGWEKLCATYFVPDRVLAGFGNELKKQDVETTVGSEMLKPFEDQTEIVDSVYVANPRKKTAYEIVRSDDDYATAYSELEEVRQSMGL